MGNSNEIIWPSNTSEVLFFPIIVDCTYISPVQREIKKLPNQRKGRYLWWCELKYLKWSKCQTGACGVLHSFCTGWVIAQGVKQQRISIRFLREPEMLLGIWIQFNNKTEPGEFPRSEIQKCWFLLGDYSHSLLRFIWLLWPEAMIRFSQCPYLKPLQRMKV